MLVAFAEYESLKQAADFAALPFDREAVRAAR
jgi:hypothetical protein